MIDISNFLFPVLHVEIGLGNDALDSFFDFFNERVENIRANKIMLHNSHLSAKAAYDDTIAKQLEYNENESIDLMAF